MHHLAGRKNRYTKFWQWVQGHNVTCIAAHCPLTPVHTRAPLQNVLDTVRHWFSSLQQYHAADFECLAPLRSLAEHSIFCSGISSPEIVSLTWLLVGLTTCIEAQCPAGHCSPQSCSLGHVQPKWQECSFSLSPLLSWVVGTPLRLLPRGTLWCSEHLHGSNTQPKSDDDGSFAFRDCLSASQKGSFIAWYLLWGLGSILCVG